MRLSGLHWPQVGPGAGSGEPITNHGHLPAPGIITPKSFHTPDLGPPQPFGGGRGWWTVPVFQMEGHIPRGKQGAGWNQGSHSLQPCSPSPQPCLCPGNCPAVLLPLGPRSTSQWPSTSQPPMVSGGMGRGAGLGEERGGFPGCGSWPQPAARSPTLWSHPL